MMDKTLVVTVAGGLVTGTDANFEPDFEIWVLDMDGDELKDDTPLASFWVEPPLVHKGERDSNLAREIARSYGRAVDLGQDPLTEAVEKTLTKQRGEE